MALRGWAGSRPGGARSRLAERGDARLDGGRSRPGSRRGIAEAIGTLALYVGAGGIPPYQELPDCLDTGTDREGLLRGRHYLGLR